MSVDPQLLHKFQVRMAELNRNQWRAGAEGFMEAIHRATETACEILGVSRSSVWLYEEHDNVPSIRCIDLCTDGDVIKHVQGTSMSSKDVPAYFTALLEEHVIAADDAMNHPATQEFRDWYLKPSNIGAMLDAPVRIQGKAVGVLCNEHVGGQRAWTVEEKVIAGAIADHISLTLELQNHKQTSDALAQHKQHLSSLVAEQTKELQETVTQLAAFNFTVSHDLLHPLRVLESKLTLLKDSVSELDNDEAQHFLDGSLDTTTRMSRLIDNLLLFSRSTHSDIMYTEIDMVGSFELALSWQGERAQGIEVELESDMPSLIADPDMLQAAVNHIVDNAVKFTAGTESPCIRIGANTNGSATEWFVQDNGIGFDPAYREMVFDPFKRFHRIDTLEGNGHGLTIAKNMCTRMNITIDIDSTPGQGTTVTLRKNV